MRLEHTPILSEEDMLKCHEDIVKVIKKYTDSAGIAKVILEKINIDEYSKL